MSDTAKVKIPHLPELAEFRFQLRGFLSFSEAASEQAGIAAQQYQLMQVIEATPTDKISSITYIAERMILKHNSAVELVDRAERVGLVARKQDENDLRRSVVSLTEKGREILAKLVSLHLAELENRSEAFLSALSTLRQSIGATTAE